MIILKIPFVLLEIEIGAVLCLIIAGIAFLILIFKIFKEASKSKNSIFWFSAIVIILVVSILAFHFVPTRLMIFPKDNFTFSNTYISEDDIEEAIERYNNASIFEQVALRNDPLIKKLLEKKLVTNRDRNNF